MRKTINNTRRIVDFKIWIHFEEENKCVPYLARVFCMWVRNRYLLGNFNKKLDFSLDFLARVFAPFISHIGLIFVLFLRHFVF